MNHLNAKYSLIFSGCFQFVWVFFQTLRAIIRLSFATYSDMGLHLPHVTPATEIHLKRHCNHAYLRENPGVNAAKERYII